MNGWKPEGPAKTIADATVQYLRSASHGHEGAHQVTFTDGRTLTVLPDTRTTARKRSRVISDAIRASQRSQHIDQMAYMVGWLLLAGANRLLVDDVDLCGTSTSRRAQWQIVLADDGHVEAVWLGDSR